MNNLASKGFVLSLLIIFGCSPDPNSATQFPPAPSNGPHLEENVIYGVDNRKDYYEAGSHFQRLADSTVALIRTKDLTFSADNVFIGGANYGQSQNLCSNERFREQNAAAYCSGSLVGKDLVITAGHCITGTSDCADTSFVFGYALKAAGVLPQSVSSSEVYRCKSIVARELKSNGADYAVIQLDREVGNHSPLIVRRQGTVSIGETLTVIGHPVGLPTKITSGARVRSLSSEHFVANLDTYGGNSGSAVFSDTTQEVVGILVRGEQDFEQRAGCVVSKICTEDSCRGEDVTKIEKVLPYLSEVTAPPQPPTDQPTLFENTTSVSIPDNNRTGIQSRLTTSLASGARKVIVSVQIVHPYVGDLLVRLTSPTGALFTLHNREGRNQSGLTKSYELVAPAGGFAAGTWRLDVSDQASRDVGQLKRWSLEFK